VEQSIPLEEDRLAVGTGGGVDGGRDLFLPQLRCARRDEPDRFPGGLANSNVLGVAV